MQSRSRNHDASGLVRAEKQRVLLVDNVPVRDVRRIDAAHPHVAFIRSRGGQHCRDVA